MAGAAELQIGERTVRVTSPDRVIYEATPRTPSITKLQVCDYFAAVGDPMIRAIGERPTTLERWPDGYREGMRLSTGYGDDGDGFVKKTPAADMLHRETQFGKFVGNFIPIDNPGITQTVVMYAGVEG